MTFEQILIEFLQWRAIERIAGIGVGGLAILLGYYLFKLGIIPPQSAVAEHRNFKIRLTKVGPGLFFALYGATLVGYISYAHPKLERIKEFQPVTVGIKDNKINKEILIAGLKSGVNNDLQKIAPAINTFHDKIFESDSLIRDNYSNDKKLKDIFSALHGVSAKLDTYLQDRIFNLTTPEVHDACINNTKLPDNVPQDICERINELREARL